MVPWNNLPDELNDLILAQLPLKDICKLACVCKKWKARLSSSTFRRLYKQIHTYRNSWLILFNGDAKALAWCPSDTSWLELKLPASSLLDWRAGGDLLCLRCKSPSKGYLLGNPLTGNWKDVPNPPSSSPASMWALLRDEERTKSRLILLHKDLSRGVQLYHSETGVWSTRILPSTFTNATPGSLDDETFFATAACIRELLYCIHAGSRSVFTYDVNRDAWKKMEMPLPTGLIWQTMCDDYCLDLRPTFVEGLKGRLLLVGGLIGGNQKMGCLAVVWELERGKGAWREVSRAPEKRWQWVLEEAEESREPSLISVKYVGYGEEVLVLVGGSLSGLSYNMREGRWTVLDVPHKNKFSSWQLVSSFEPWLQACA